MSLLTIKEDLKDISPRFVKKSVKASLKTYRKLRNRFQCLLVQRNLTEKDIVGCLKDVGIQEGDVVLVHSSLTRLGIVTGGAQTVVTALLKTVGSLGTIGAPTFWGNTGIYLQGNRTFNVSTSPSILGIISETIRKNPRARRSLHPTHSAAFIGPQAEFLTENHHLDNTPVGGPNSPYMKLIGLNAKILLLGVTLEYLTSFHTIEDLFPDFPYQVYLKEPLVFDVIDKEGQKISVSTYCHDPAMGRQAKGIKMGRYLRENGVVAESQLGNALVMVLQTRLLHETLLALYGKGITMYSPGY